ncbi:hypothetical protein [Paenibacillus terreus]|uniref:hypothetical protein n=1 Tax=Paenibacillus terreus TaxID=1387834 RepID=UPI0035CD2C14
MNGFGVCGHNSPYPGQCITTGLSAASVAAWRDKVRRKKRGQHYRRLAAGIVSTHAQACAALTAYGALSSGPFTVPM